MSNVSENNAIALKRFLQMAIPIAQHQLTTGQIELPSKEELEQLAEDIGSKTDGIVGGANEHKDVGKIVGRMAKAIAYVTLEDEAKQKRIDEWLNSLDDSNLRQ